MSYQVNFFFEIVEISPDHSRSSSELFGCLRRFSENDRKHSEQSHSNSTLYTKSLSNESYIKLYCGRLPNASPEDVEYPKKTKV